MKRQVTFEEAIKRYEGKPVGQMTIERSGQGAICLVRSAEIVKVSQELSESPTVTYAFTTTDFDHCNETFLLQGIDTTVFQRNPVCPWSHFSWMPPVGNGSNLRIAGEKYLIDITYHGIGEFAQEIRDMAVARILRAVSQGVIPIEVEEFDAAEFIEEGIASPLYPTARRYTKSTLLEVSPCTIPMLPSALAQDGDETDAQKALLRSNEDLVRKAVSDGIIRADGALATFLARATGTGITIQTKSQKRVPQRQEAGARARVVEKYSVAISKENSGHVAAIKKATKYIMKRVAKLEEAAARNNEEDKSMTRTNKAPGDGTGTEPTLADVMAAITELAATVDEINGKVDEINGKVDQLIGEEEAEEPDNSEGEEMGEEEMKEFEEELGINS